MRRVWRYALAWVLALPAAAAGQNAPSLQGIGDLSGGPAASAALAVSADATTVVGWSETASATEAVVWTPGGGLVGLGTPSASVPFSQATAVSDDGGVVTGTVATSSGGRAFRWSGSGYTTLGTFGCFLCDPSATGEGISGNGLVVVGSGFELGFLGSPHVNAARWAGGGTSISDLGDLTGGGEASIAYDATTTGSLIVGEGDSSAGPSAFRWTSGSGMQSLPGLAGALHAAGALAVAADGSVIVGYANASATGTNRPEPVRWVGPGFTTAENLGALPGQASARGRAYDVTADGGIVVGTTRDAAGQDTAFVWEAATGMRSLADLLRDEYGVDPAGWALREARGVSDVNAAGEFTVVGLGTNPAGEEEGFVAVLSPTHCNDGTDNDSDGDVDFPADPGCTAPGDRSEGPDCSDGLDNDGDGLLDGSDPDCTAPDDLSELADCANGIDDDGDGLADFPLDPGCRSAAAQHEAPECDDGVDNDGDTAVDFGADAQCLDPSDTSERDDCADGVDNDGDGLVDFPADPDCTAPDDPAEDAACADFVDNDGDGRLDYPAAYPACASAADATEAPECSGGQDDDGDGDVDFPADAGCGGPLFPVEAPADPAVGDVLVVDRAQATLYALDPASGAEQVLSSGAQLQTPEGLAVRGDGRLVVSSPAGVFEVEPRTGLQSARSGALASSGDLPVEVDSNGDLVVLEGPGISRIDWGTGAATALLTVPVGASELQFFVGNSLALEDDDTAYVTGIGLLGDGVFRADLAAGTVTKVTPGFLSHVWRDLVLEDANTLLAVGDHASQGEGVYRIALSGGTVTTLSADPAWQHPESVAVAGDGSIYVADSGACSDGSCTGGLVARVDAVSGARTVVRAGLFAGPLQVDVLGALPPACDDGIDDDGDGLVDAADPGCTDAADASEHDPALPCDDGIDDDGDGAPDFPADLGCRDAEWPLEDPQCSDGIENDADGWIDWDGAGVGPPDPQCVDKPWRNREKKNGGRCGLGFEVALVLPWLLRRAARRRA